MSASATDDEDFAPPPEKPEPQPPPRKRFRRLRKVALWALGILALAVLFYYAARAQVARVGERQLKLENERLDLDEPGWRLDSILEARKKAEPPADENSAPVVLEIAERVPDDWKKWRNSEESTAFWSRHHDNHLPTQGAIDEARKHAADTFFVRADAVRLRDKRGGAFALAPMPDGPLALVLPHLDKCRVVLSLLQYDAFLAACAEKNPNRGISAARAALAVARAIGDEPTMISQLVRGAAATIASQTAMQVLAWGQPTEGLAELQAELLAEADAGHFRVGMRGERACVDRFFIGLANGTIPAEHWLSYADIHNPGPEHYAMFRAYLPFLTADHAKTLELTTKYIEVSKMPWQNQLTALKEVPIPPAELRFTLTRQWPRACENGLLAGMRCRADLLSAATCLACERFRLKHNRWPRDLNELVPAFLPEVTQNPFTGKPLTYRTFADRIAVFAWWANATYTRADEQPADLREGDVPGMGIGYRVWVPAHRGLRAREKEQEKKDP